MGPGEVKTLHGLVRNTKDMHTAVTEHIDSSLSSDLTICLRVVSLKSFNAAARNLTYDMPYKDTYRRIPPGLYEEVRQHLKEIIEADAIRPSESLYSSNVVLLHKKDGSHRFCIDFRKLNSPTVKDAYNLPRVNDTIYTLICSKYFSKLDIRSGYWQVEIDEADKYKTVLTVGNMGFVECNRMAFGLINAPATFQRVLYG